jgi:hypothetical protein
MEAVDAAPTETGALRLTLEVWHPDCWVLATTRVADVGLLSYGCYTRQDGHATTVFTLYADTTGDIEDGVEAILDAPAVYDVAEMTRGHRGQRRHVGNATRELLVDHDGTTQISDAFTSRGFVPAEPVDARSNTEYWTLLTHHDREDIERLLDEIRRAEEASVSVTSIGRAAQSGGERLLPLDRLSSRQREVFRFARRRGYYEQPRRTDIGALATELGLSSSTVHEHLRKAEAKLLGDADR